MILFDDSKLTRALKEYDLIDSVALIPVTFSKEFDVRMDKLIRQKQRSYNMRVIFQYAVSAFIITALVGSLFYFLLQQQDINNDPVSLQDTTHVSALPAARGNIYDRNGVLLVSSRLSSSDNSYIREYHTTYASHLLGNDGAELVFDEYLRVSEEADEQVSGQHVYLTIDLELQIVAENALREQIEKVNLERQENGFDETELIPGGAVVVLNAITGEILAAASYPALDMLNRTTQAIYSPGSTFKMVTTLAGFRNVPTLTRDLTIDDTGIFDRYGDLGEIEGFVLNCWIYNLQGVGHGPLDIVQALECSCDFYFIQLADWLWFVPPKDGAHMIADAAKEFGLGKATGLEFPENEGRLSLPEVREADNGSNEWYIADNLLSGLGLSYNRFTPVQLANYAATIANGGTHYSLSFLKSVRSSDFSKEILTFEPNVLNNIKETDIIKIIQEGMVAASRGSNGTARNIFGDYPITIASKTGLMLANARNYDDGTIYGDNVFVAYAPAENPEIAISIVLEKGGSDEALIDISKIIFDHFFNIKNT